MEEELLSPAEADWPLELRLPSAPPPAAPSEPEMGMDDSQFLGSIMGESAQAQHEPLPLQGAQVVVKKKRGRPPKNRDAAAAAAAAVAAVAVAVVPAANPVSKAAKRREDEEEVVCFICFDGGDLVVCDRRGCPKVYHPACIKRDAAFFQSRSKWNCGWHICSSCEKAVRYMCYSCTYSVCKVCIKQGKFFSVRGTKGFCDTCFGTILLIESKDEGGTKVKVDFDDRNSWEYLFKLYWLDLKGKLSLTMEEVTDAKNRWNIPITATRKEKDDSSGDLYDANNDDNVGSDCSSRKRKRNNLSRKRGRKCQKENSSCSIAAEKIENATGDAGSLHMKVPSEGAVLPLDTKWASPELLEFVGHMRDGDQSFISQFDVQALLLDYIKKNDLRDPRRKSQIICDLRLHRLFKKTRVAHFEMLKLLEMQFLVNEASTANDGSQGANNSNSAQVDGSGFSEIDKVCPGRKKKMHRKMERESLVNLKDYAAIDMHNINLIYLRRNLMEDLIDDSTFSDKIAGGFVRIKISGLGHKQDMYRLVKVIGTHKVPEKYNTGKKTTNLALEILNLSKKEIITMDTVSNQDFTEEECTRLRQSMKYGLISPLKVGDIQEKAMIFQSVRVNDWLENEKQRLGHLRDRASETGRRKELRECVEKLQLLNTCEERTRRINEVLEVHVDSHMDPDYESDEEMDDKIAAERNVNGTRFGGFFSPIKKRNHAQKICDISSHPKNLSKQCTVRELGAGKNSENLHSTVGTDIPKSGTNVNSTIREAASLSSSGVTLSNDMEPEKVWHYKDPSGNVQGPFTLMQLSKWTTYFPRDLRVWLTFESEERSLLLTEVLSKQPKDFSQAASVTSSKTMLAGSGQNRDSPSVDLNITLSPVGYSMVNSSEITVQSTKYSVPERGSVNSFDDRLSLSTSSVPPKDADTTNSRVQYQTKHSVPSPGSPYEHSELRHDRVQGRCSGEWNKHHSRGGPCSPEMPQTSCSGQSNVESHHNQHALWSQVQHDSKINVQAGSVKDLDSRLDYLQTVPSQLIRRDVPSPVLDSSPSESRTASSQHESPCLSSTTNTGLHDELHSSISSENAKSCTPATLVEDRGSSSPSGMLSQLERVPICSSQSVPSASISEICKMEEVKYQQKPLEADASNASVNQSPQSKMFPDSSTDNQNIEREYPSPTPRSESKEPAVGHSGSTSVAPEIFDTKIPDHPPVASVSPKSGPLTEEIVATRSVPNLEKKYVSGEDSNIQKELYRESKLVTNEKMVVDPDSCTESINVSNVLESVSNLERRDLKGEDSNIKKELFSESTLVTSEKMVVNPASCAELIDVSDVLESVPNLEERDIKGGNSNIEKELCSESTPVTGEKMVVDPASCTESVDVSGVLESVSNLEKRDLKGEDSNIQKELCSESTPVTSEKMVVDPASCAESIDVSDVLESVPNLEKRDIKGRDSNIEKEVCSESTLVTSEKMVVDLGSCTESVDVPYVLESVSNLEKSDLKGEDANIQKELFSESTLVTNEKMVVDPASCADSIYVSDVLKSVSNLDKTDLKVEDSVIKKELHDETVFVTRENMVVNPASCADLIDVSDVLESVSNLEKTDLKIEDSVIKKELHDETVFVTRENMVVNSASCADLIDVSDVLESVSNLEKTDLKSEDSVIQRELQDESIFVTRESMVVDPASYAESIDVSDVLESVSNLEKTDLKGVGSNVQKELHEESTLFTIENMVVDPVPFAGPVDVPCVLESSIKQRCGTSCMDAIAAIEEFMNNSGDEEPQCSSPIALSPWGEPSYYQGDSVDSVLWSVQDYPMSDMWSFPSPTPVLEHLSGVESDGKGIAHVIDSVTVTLEDNEIVQRGATPGEGKVELANQGASTAWGLAEQVKSKGIAASVSPIDRSTGILDWQPSANGSSNMDTAWSTSQDPNLFSYERAAPSVKTSQETSGKQECTELGAANFGEALGNTKSWNPSTGNANRGSQRSHNRDRYSQISESWLLSSNYSRSSRSDGFGSSRTSRTAPRGQTQRGICKFYESGYCRKGSSCNYLHPSSLQ